MEKRNLTLPEKPLSEMEEKYDYDDGFTNFIVFFGVFVGLGILIWVFLRVNRDSMQRPFTKRISERWSISVRRNEPDNSSTIIKPLESVIAPAIIPESTRMETESTNPPPPPSPVLTPQELPEPPSPALPPLTPRYSDPPAYTPTPLWRYHNRFH